MPYSSEDLDVSRLRHLRKLQAGLIGVSKDKRDLPESRWSNIELAISLGAEVENHCVVLLKLPDVGDPGPNDVPVPVGSGVLVYSEAAPCEGWGILTAAHVLDRFIARGGLSKIWVASPSYIRGGKARRPVALQSMRQSFVARCGPQHDNERRPPDMAWIGLNEADARLLDAYRCVFFNCDKNRHTIPSMPSREPLPAGAIPRFGVGIVVGTLGYNFRTGTGPEPIDGEVPLNLQFTMCGAPASSANSPEALDSIDFEVIHRTEEYGSLGDPVANALVPDTWKGTSGAGYWHLVFGEQGDPSPFEVRLEGIVFAQLERESSGRQCLRANSAAAVRQLLRHGRAQYLHERESTDV